MILAQTSPTFLQNRSPDRIDNIYYAHFLHTIVVLQCAVVVVHPNEGAGLDPMEVNFFL